MSIGLTLLVVVGILFLFGIGHRVLDRMRLNDKAALLFMLAILIGSLIPDIPLGRRLSINVGGAVIPLILAGYVFSKAGTSWERTRTVLASVLSGVGVFIAGRILPHEPETMIVDPNYIYGIIAGIIAYLFGRSRRASFIAGILGVLLADIGQGIINSVQNIPSPVRLGGAGVVDAVVISGFLAVFLAEAVGEFREKIQGGTSKKDMTFHKGEFIKLADLDADKEREDEGEKQR
ncbi:MAG: DUF1614 domain-containing protein [Clostridiales bacterium]|nr:DUF1614 domain-containing protein [Clostridiales bacterium]